MSSHTRHVRGGFNLLRLQKSGSTYLSNAHPIPKEHCFWKVPRFRCFSFWWEKHVEEDECGAWVEWYWQGRTEILGEKPVPVPLCPLQMSCGQGLGSNQGRSGEWPVTDHLSHGMAFWGLKYIYIMFKNLAPTSQKTLCLYNRNQPVNVV
jgi:hypothetical protein